MSGPSGTRLQLPAARPVSRPHDSHEREAASAADVVVRGGQHRRLVLFVGRILIGYRCAAPAGLHREDRRREEAGDDLADRRGRQGDTAGEGVIRLTQPDELAGRVMRVVLDEPGADALRQEGAVAFDLDSSDLELDLIFSGARTNLEGETR